MRRVTRAKPIRALHTYWWRPRLMAKHAVSEWARAGSVAEAWTGKRGGDVVKAESRPKKGGRAEEGRRRMQARLHA